MPSKLIPRILRLTEEQDAALKQIAESADEPINSLIRRLLKEEAERKGIDWPENMPTWGGNRHGEKPETSV